MHMDNNNNIQSRSERRKKKNNNCNTQLSDLPTDLWPIIGKFLDGRIDVLRFRSVCTLWRSYLPPYMPPPPCFFAHWVKEKKPGLLSLTTTYRMESDVNSNQIFLVKLEEDPCSSKLRFLHPVTNYPIRILKGLNMSDFRFVKLRKSRGLKFGQGDSVHKMVYLGRKRGIFSIYNGGELAFQRFGDENWTPVGDQNSCYHDIIVYKGQCYVVDELGRVSWVDDSTMEVSQFSPPITTDTITSNKTTDSTVLEFQRQMHLVKSCGDIYVVDHYFEVTNVGEKYYKCSNDFEVYRLDQKWGKWVDVENLGDRVFILSQDGSFSVSSTEFPGLDGNCIIFPGSTSPYPIYVFFLQCDRTQCITSNPVCLTYIYSQISGL